MNEPNKACLYCSKPLEGRTDKKYCSQYCKSAFQYAKNQSEENSLYRTIQNQLRLNRKILKRHNRIGKTTIRKEDLQTEGFNPKYFTHYWKNNKAQVYLFYYEFGFLAIKDNEQDKYLLVTHQPYMD